jgi:NADPH-dependent glutamate synthase beta subunit-like oxidoreductase
MNVKSRVEKIPIYNMPPVGTQTFTFKVKIDREKCTGCGICAIECPSRVIEMDIDGSKASPSHCFSDCLASNDVRAAMKAVNDGGDYAEAWKMITAVNPLPACTGRACPHPCEDDCSRSHLDKAVNIHGFERFVGDYGIEHGLCFDAPSEKNKGRVAVVGSGPSGLSCAYHLSLRGYDVTIFEKDQKLGGMLRYGIPTYRIPDDVLNSEIQNIVHTGITVECGRQLGKDIFLNQLKGKYDAVYLALGTQKEMRLGVPGEDAVNCNSGLRFLKSVAEKNPLDTGSQVVVVGGGNVAMDSARSAIRAGAKKVTVVCLESRWSMPAWDHEVAEALEEGVELLNGYGPMEIYKKGNVAKGASFKKCVSLFDEKGTFAPKYDETDTVTLELDSLIVAIGQKPDTAHLGRDGGVAISSRGHIHIADEVRCATNVIGVFAGGDATALAGGGKIAGGIRTGRRAALAIDSFIQGTALEAEEPSALTCDHMDQNKYNNLIVRNEDPMAVVSLRKQCMGCEIVSTLSSTQMQKEIERCLVCGTAVAKYVAPQSAEKFNMACNNCHNCVSACKEKAIKFEYYTKVINGQWC